jgi:hypothetical protein
MKKRRSINQIKEEKSYSMFKKAIPEAWVIHEYGPDYGIDCVVELFDYVDESNKIAETLGEIFFVQLKSSTSVKYTQKRVYGRENVEKGKLVEHKDEYKDIDVIEFNVEMSLLLTIQSMGVAVPVILILVDIRNNRIFFVCLNDYLDKIIIPEDINYSQKNSKAIYIPVANEIKKDESSLIPLRVYGKRSKMYGAFSKFNYQLNEINYASDFYDYKRYESNREMILKFVETSLSLDIWNKHDFFVLKYVHNDLLEVKKNLEKCDNSQNLKALLQLCCTCWKKLSNLGNIYEEIIREHYLPTVFSTIL